MTQDANTIYDMTPLNRPITVNTCRIYDKNSDAVKNLQRVIAVGKKRPPAETVNVYTVK
jgi:hypothetical protein